MNKRVNVFIFDLIYQLRTDRSKKLSNSAAAKLAAEGTVTLAENPNEDIDIDVKTTELSEEPSGISETEGEMESSAESIQYGSQAADVNAAVKNGNKLRYSGADVMSRLVGAPLTVPVLLKVFYSQTNT